MRRKDDAVRLDPHTAGGIGLHRRLKSPGESKPANLTRQFAALIRYEPGVNLPVRFRARPAIEHHPEPAMLH